MNTARTVLTAPVVLPTISRIWRIHATSQIRALVPERKKQR
jgi:hypothetical protein